jgi:hypothetical protein
VESVRVVASRRVALGDCGQSWGRGGARRAADPTDAALSRRTCRNRQQSGPRLPPEVPREGDSALDRESGGLPGRGRRSLSPRRFWGDHLVPPCGTARCRGPTGKNPSGLPPLPPRRRHLLMPHAHLPISSRLAVTTTPNSLASFTRRRSSRGLVNPCRGSPCRGRWRDSTVPQRNRCKRQRVIQAGPPSSTRSICTNWFKRTISHSPRSDKR